MEFVVAMGIGAGIIFMVGALSGQFSGIANFVNLKLQSRQGSDHVFETMAREIRSMGPSSLGAYPIEAASSTSFIFFSDIDGDGLMERVRYFRATTTLEKGVIKPSGNPLVYATSTETTRVVVSDLIGSGGVFEYFDSAYTGTQSPMAPPVDAQAIRIVRASLSSDINPGSGPLPAFFSVTVNLRNLRSN